jgi:hypothetical protein
MWITKLLFEALIAITITAIIIVLPVKIVMWLTQ